MAEFVGRQAELDLLLRALETERLVTLLGTAGTGKTALAGEVEATIDGDVVWARPGDLELLIEAPPALVVLDDQPIHNGTRERVETLACATQVLVVGRDIAGLAGERVIALGPLPRSEALVLLTKQLPDATEAQRLAGLSLTDGLPGAIDIVARASATMDLDAILRELADTFEGLRSTGRRLPRSATMQVVHQWWEECCLV